MRALSWVLLRTGFGPVSNLASTLASVRASTAATPTPESFDKFLAETDFVASLLSKLSPAYSDHMRDLFENCQDKYWKKGCTYSFEGHCEVYQEIKKCICQIAPEYKVSY